jgi:hypothetical protein
MFVLWLDDLSRGRGSKETLPVHSTAEASSVPSPIAPNAEVEEDGTLSEQ